MQTFQELQDKIVELEQKLERYKMCPIYNILTRTALEDIWEDYREKDNLAIAFIDIDDLKIVNSDIGQNEANKKISKAFSEVRRSELVNFEIGRYFSGDEFVILANANDIEKPCKRLLTAFKNAGMSVTIVIMNHTGETTLTDAVIDANTVNQIAKKQGKGRIYNFLNTGTND
jgi:GGDEF domain-containing protein